MNHIAMVIFAAILACNMHTKATTILSPPSSTTPTRMPIICIAGCKCEQDIFTFTSKLTISDCVRPLNLTNTTLVNAVNSFATVRTYKVSVLRIRNVSIEHIDGGAFYAFPSLETVEFSMCRIGGIASNAFDFSNISIESISMINFNNCTFDHYDSTTINYNQLEELLFTNCQLKRIPNLTNLHSLILLNLEGNHLDRIEVDAFKNLPNLEELNLSNNRIRYIPANVFAVNSALITLRLDRNPLERFELNSRSNLEYLSLHSCQLSSFPKSTSSNLDLLNYLDLSSNHIMSWENNVFANMTELNYIDLSYNKLVSLDDYVFADCVKLDKIILDGNDFRYLPKFRTNSDLFRIIYFSCNACGLTQINANTFKYTPAITTLILSNNKLSNISHAFDLLTHVNEIDLSNNSITTLIEPNTFAANEHLRVLNLANNQLKRLNPLALNNLKQLDLSHNNLKQLWLDHNGQLKYLDQLYLSNNHITRLTMNDLHVVPNIRLLDIEMNPLLCSSDLCDVIVWLVKQNVYPKQSEHMLQTHAEHSMSDQIELLINEQSSNESPADAWKQFAIGICGDIEMFTNDFTTAINTIKMTIRTPTTLPSPIVSSVISSNDIENNDSKFDNGADDADNYDDDDDYYDDYEFDNDDLVDKSVSGHTVENILVDSVKIKDSKSTHTNNVFESSLSTNPPTNPAWYTKYGTINLKRVSYVMSLTSIFVLTALVVLTMAVGVILSILRRRSTTLQEFDNNVPHVKIPLWQTIVRSGQKKHSGSVYRPLSEEYAPVPRATINRYEFNTAPIVHNSNVP